MDLRSLSLGEKIAAGSGAAFFVFLFLSWIEDENAWQLFRIVHVLLAILALTAVIFPLAKAAGYRSQLQPSDRAILIRVGAVALVFVLAYFLEALNNAQIGLWLSVLAAAGVFYGGLTTPGEDAPARRRERTRRPLAEQDYEEPPPGMESWRETAPAATEEGAAGDPGVAPSRTAAESETDPGPGSTEPGRAARRRRDTSFDELEFDAGPEQTETRRPRRPPSAPPSSGR